MEMPWGSVRSSVPCGPLTYTVAPLRVTVTPEGTAMGERPTRDIRPPLGACRGCGASYQTWQSTSPPRWRWRASESVNSPWLVETTATPMPPSTRGIPSARA